LVRAFGLAQMPLFAPRYNIAPTQTLPIIRAAGGDSAVGDSAGNKLVDAERPDGMAAAGRQWTLARWGLVPSWAKDPKIGNQMINARSETAATKPSFRAAMQRRRCLVPADGFYEWQAQGGQKQPFYIGLAGGGPFAFAGLWEHWRGPDEEFDSYTILTTTANERLQALHERMPVILCPADYDTWLDPAVAADAVQTLMRPYAAEEMAAFPVSREVNNPRNDTPACIEALA
jgi:putative SOS response-associated peptidase YedK